MAAASLPRLHVITDDAILARADFLHLAQALLQLPDLMLHLRGHDTSAAKLYAIAERLQGSVAINDRLDIALATGAKAVQLGARSLPLDVVRRRHPDVMLGYSAHSVEEAVRAEQDGADFLLLGTIYPTASHPGVTGAGPDLVRNCARACRSPVIAIGGITPERVAAVQAAGAHGVAVIRAVWDAPDPVQAAGVLVSLLHAERHH